MYFSSAFFASIALVVPAFVAPHPLINVVKYAGETNGYIVTFKTSKAALLYGAKKNNIKYCYKIINGCAGKFTNKQLQELQANSDVTGIYEDGVGGTAMIQFILDDFGGRAKWGKTLAGQPDIDENGHGTSCSGVAAGSSYGVAKHANIIAVKVFDNPSVVLTSDVIAGLDYIHDSVKTSHRPSVVNISLWFHASQLLDYAVTKLTRDNIIVVTSAGNFAKSASSYSPARVPSAITVAASNITDQQTSFSNYGPAVDIFAPGEDIVCPSIQDKYSTRVSFGTSYSAAYVSGLVATIYALGNFTTDEMKDALNSLALQGVLTNVYTPNILVQNGLPYCENK
ncbi:hypothetical protein C0995_001231 [Termitomyces sp. Mi166|nr:hypothetical protein C0995_001231 [Termitomyces sp. Mi166\